VTKPTLTIRAVQMEALNGPRLQAVEDRLFQRVTTKFPATAGALGDAQTRQLIRRGMGKARRLRLGLEPHVAALVDLVFEFGLDFDTTGPLSWAHAILTERGLDAGARIGLVIARLEAFEAAGMRPA